MSWLSSCHLFFGSEQPIEAETDFYWYESWLFCASSEKIKNSLYILERPQASNGELEDKITNFAPESDNTLSVKKKSAESD